jgi:hypothetical protein
LSAANLSIVETQAELETRAARFAGVDFDAPTDLKSVLGSATEWTIQVGPVHLFLIPFFGEWWFFDEVHHEWRFTGKKIGEARFLFENGVFRVVDASAAADAASPQSAPLSEPRDSHAAPASATIPRFCSACGAPAQPDWNFCLKCGAKLKLLSQE